LTARERTPEEYANAAVLWRAHRRHVETGWCPLCQQPGPCAQWGVTRAALVAAGLVAPLHAVNRWAER
jgi:hypothetical protein